MRSDPQASAPASPRRKHLARLLRRWALLLLIATCVYGAWREYDFRLAVREAKEGRISFSYRDPLETIRSDWRAVFRASTWKRSGGGLDIDWDDQHTFVVEHDLVRRLRPTVLTYFAGRRMSHAPIKDPERPVPRLRNLDHLAGCSSLEFVTFRDCNELEKIDGLKSLTGLKYLFFDRCGKLKDIEPLKSLNDMVELRIYKCPGLPSDAQKQLERALPERVSVVR